MLDDSALPVRRRHLSVKCQRLGYVQALHWATCGVGCPAGNAPHCTFVPDPPKYVPKQELTLMAGLEIALL